MTTPTQLTLRELRKTHPLVEVVEHWCAFPRPGHRKDLFGIFDIIAIRGDSITAVQCTSWSNVSARVRKMRESGVLAHWCSPSRSAEVWGWKKKGGRWVSKLVWITQEETREL